MDEIELIRSSSLDSTEQESNLSDLLKRLDPEAYKLVWNNPKKIGTYLESYASHESIIERNKNSKVVHEDTLIFWISSDRKVLNERIDKRADGMVTKGLLEEIKQFEEKYGVVMGSSKYIVIKDENLSRPK
ncbi:Oidioi.mRNA.OKI2018_I69.chr1.g3293.t1.cds [Oikopleura dioica]|uniref:Oidioi.mRNA.OKI2018_I69.chr1.g3293.t1.cds n=1 Tax=Oikopleura dioica TaxID=34765 RepID=A0ABN7SZ47_OIKDI|nr:Oidioi.mRNA.OKI2018_I69.chr1.g3293.t1.cds [Oikopleura dioica]